jgi:hypothetical protein
MPNGNGFLDATWQEIVSIIASSFAMDESRKTALANNAVAKLIAAIPFQAGCREPERTALAHLATYILAASAPAKKAFTHKSQDDYDVLARLAAIAGFEGGDPVVINRGMKLLAISMISGYKRDAGSDKTKGIYNPVSSGKWNADDKIASLTSAVAAAPNVEMDQIMTPQKAAQAWWDPW